jgi:hypothetical protein
MVPKQRRNSRSVYEAILNNSWVADVADELTVENCTQCIRLWEQIEAVLRDDQEQDKFTWTCAPSGQYSAKSTYDMLCEGNITCRMHKLVWKSAATPTAKLFCWLALRYRLWTSDMRFRHGLQDASVACFTCLQEEDNVDHILMQCPYARDVWFKCLQSTRLQIQEPHQDSVLEEWWLESRQRVSKLDRRKYDSMIALVARSLWKQRNARVFNNARL